MAGRSTSILRDAEMADRSGWRRPWRWVLARIDAWATRPARPGAPGSQMHRAARDVTGGIGLATTSAWDTMVEGHQRYLSSFDPRVPPSAFVSEADVQRRGAVMPIAERCLEDLAQGELEDLAQGELEDLAQGETPEGE